MGMTDSIAIESEPVSLRNNVINASPSIFNHERGILSRKINIFLFPTTVPLCFRLPSRWLEVVFLLSESLSGTVFDQQGMIALTSFYLCAQIFENWICPHTTGIIVGHCAGIRLSVWGYICPNNPFLSWLVLFDTLDDVYCLLVYVSLSLQGLHYDVLGWKRIELSWEHRKWGSLS